MLRFVAERLPECKDLTRPEITMTKLKQKATPFLIGMALI